MQQLNCAFKIFF